MEGRRKECNDLGSWTGLTIMWEFHTAIPHLCYVRETREEWHLPSLQRSVITLPCEPGKSAGKVVIKKSFQASMEMMRAKVTQSKRIYLSTKNKVGTLPVQGIRDVLIIRTWQQRNGYSAPRNKIGVQSVFNITGKMLGLVAKSLSPTHSAELKPSHQVNFSPWT